MTALLDLDGVSRRQSTVRFDVLDRDLEKIGELHPDVDSVPRVENNINRTIKRTMDGLRLAPDDAAAIDPLSDRVRPVWVVSDGSEYECGVFLWADTSRLVSTRGTMVEGTMADQTLMVDQPAGHTISFPGGATIVGAMAEVLAGIELGGLIAESPATFPAAVAWKAGDSRWKVLADLCESLGYAQWFDNQGRYRALPVPNYATADPDLTYDAPGGMAGRIVADSIVESDDTLDAPNRYVVIGTAASNAPVSAYYDAPAEAPGSKERRGYVVADVYESQSIGAWWQAYDAAKARYNSGGAAYRWVEFDSTPDPRHDTFDVVRFLGANYREQSWRLPLREGSAMHHSLRRAY